MKMGKQVVAAITEAIVTRLHADLVSRSAFSDPAEGGLNEAALLADWPQIITDTLVEIRDAQQKKGDLPDAKGDLPDAKGDLPETKDAADKAAA